MENKKTLSKRENNLNKEAEDMRCYTCKAITGHVLTGKYWSCWNCGSYRKGISPFLKRVLNGFKFWQGNNS